MNVAAHERFEDLAWTIRRLRKAAMRWSGFAYRSSTVEYANQADILSGMCSRLYGGRWNPPQSFRTVYASLSPEAAMAEALALCRYYCLPLTEAMPRIFVALRVDLKRVLDLTHPAHLSALNLTCVVSSVRTGAKRMTPGARA